MSVPDAADPAVPSAVESPRGKLVYLYLDSAGPASADEVASALDLAKLAVFGVLRTLRRRGLVARTDGEYRLQ